MSKINIFMTGAGAPGAAGIIKCLRLEPSFSITVADANPDAYGKHLADAFETIPPATSSLFADTLFSICKKRAINVILPLVTRELIPLAAEKTAFEKEGVKIPVSSLASLEIANHKGHLYKFLQSRGIPVPEFRMVNTAAQFQEAVHQLGYPFKPVCFKPTESNGSRGFRIMDAQINELELLLNYKPGAAYISFDDAMRILSSGNFPEMVVSEYLPGDEYSVDCLANQGQAVLIAPRLRKKIINGISEAGEFIYSEEIIRYCRQIIQELGLHGNIGIQVKESAAGSFLLLEVNPRVQGSISAGLGAGINLPVLAIKQELGLPIAPEELMVKWGTKFYRYREELFF